MVFWALVWGTKATIECLAGFNMVRIKVGVGETMCMEENDVRVKTLICMGYY